MPQDIVEHSEKDEGLQEMTYSVETVSGSLMQRFPNFIACDPFKVFDKRRLSSPE
jgi:hypothetical protein